MGELWFGHYRLDRLLGSGGTGEVWLAHDTLTQRDVALKILAAASAADPTYRQRFTREARLAAQVRGPHIMPIHTFGELEGRLYIDMEFIEGTDVAALLRSGGPMSPVRAVEIVAQTATALDLAHRAGLVHRDVKPSNIMVGANGYVHLIDFGTASRIDQPAITADSNVVGTIAYMAPERFSGGCDGRADQYSLACVLYECLTGQRPFGDIDSAQQLRANLMADPPSAAAVNPAVSAALDTVVARGLSKDPNLRWSSAGEMAADAFAAVTGREAATVEITAATVPTTAVLTQPQRVPSAAGSRPPLIAMRRQAGEPRLVLGPRFATAAISALIAVVAVAIWLGRPTVTETDSAAAPSTSRVPHTPIEPARPPRADIPVAGQSCDPAFDAGALAADGTPLACVPGDGHLATWIPTRPHTDKPTQGNDMPALEGAAIGDNNAGTGDDNPGAGASGNSDDGDHGSDKPRNDKPGHAKPGHAKPGHGKPGK
ncbi:protein kinase domain-containing protein [Nocardia sp. KC 131]|uniref:protein kinase domain-containing protein n=1 Tax=Nocardia arseniciresistens TaxID=3392119 RepID=UPI00398F1A73